MEIPTEETMLFRYSCKDMGLNCLFVTKGQTLDEVTKTAIEHVLENHRDDFNSLQSPEEIEKMKQSLARSTRVVAG
jgi:predicted small metal-binding protein